MLVLTRKTQEQIHIGDNITISILKLKGNTVRIGIEAPRDIRVLRGELPNLAESLDIEMPEDSGVEAACSAVSPNTGDSEQSEEEATVSEMEWEFLKKLSSRRSSCLHVRRCSPKQSGGAPLARLVRSTNAVASPALLNE